MNTNKVVQNPNGAEHAELAKYLDAKQASRILEYKHGMTISEDDDPATIYYVVSGRVRVLDSRTDTLIDIAKKDECIVVPEFGYAAADGIVEVEKRNIVDCASDVQIRKAFLALMLRSHKRVASLAVQGKPALLAGALVDLSVRFGQKCAHGGELDFAGITQSDIADLIGATRSFTSTMINEMKRAGHVGNVGRTICIRDSKALRKLASKTP